MSIKLQRILCLAAVAALPLAACGGDDDTDDNGTGSDTTAADGGDSIVVTAQDSLAFDPDTVEAPAGEIALTLVNDGSLPHTLVIEGHEDEMKLTVGDVDEDTITLDAGEYTFYCDVAGHRGAGMEGTLTVG